MKKFKNFLKGMQGFRFAQFISLLVVFPALYSCNHAAGETTQTLVTNAGKLIIIGYDKSGSTKTFSKPDTTLIRTISNSLAATGGTIVFYGIGNPTDESGLRCQLVPVPPVNRNQLMSHQVDEIMAARKVSEKNEQAVKRFLELVQRILTGAAVPDANTDIQSFLKKADILLGEPQFSNCNRTLFIISDGIQSINNVDHPAQLKFSSTDFNLCLCGWKAPVPNGMRIIRFESPDGFVQYLSN